MRRVVGLVEVGWRVGVCHVVKIPWCLKLWCMSPHARGLYGGGRSLEYMCQLRLMDFQDGDGKDLHDALHVLARLLEFLCQIAHDFGDVHGVRLEIKKQENKK